MNAQKIVQFLDDYLNIHTIEDESNNGLQVESPEEIEKIGFSVDACIDVFRRAHTEGCQLIVVHHGLIWGGIKYMRGDVYKRVKFLMNSNIGLYACHLPLDIHKKVGNNTQMAHLLGLNITGEFGPYRNINLGLLCQADLPLNELTSKIQKTLGDYTLFQFGGDHCKKVGIVTGSGTVALKSAVEQDCDTFITGEPKHASYHTAKENNLNVIFAGHYRTETLGIKALMEKVKEQFAIDTVFIDVPTGHAFPRFEALLFFYYFDPQMDLSMEAYKAFPFSKLRNTQKSGKKYYKIIFLESFIQTEGRFYTDRMRIIYLLKTLQKIIYEILTC